MARKASNAVPQLFLWLSVIGAVNWGLVGLFDWDLVRALLGNETATPSSAISRAVYTLVGVAGVALAIVAPRLRAHSRAELTAGTDARPHAEAARA